MKKLVVVALLILSSQLFPQSKTFIREYTYTAGEADSKITSRAIALDQVKRLLLEETGVYLQSEFTVSKEEKGGVYSELTKQQIQSITAGITETKIIEEKWTGEKYYIKASITVDSDEVNKNIVRISEDKSLINELEDVKKTADEAMAEIARLRNEISITKNENERLVKLNQYDVNARLLSASDWFQKGYNAGEAKDYDNALLFYEKAIDLNPRFSMAYNNIGVIYEKRNNLTKSMFYYTKAIETEPNNSIAMFNLGANHQTKGDIKLAIKFYEKVIEINPEQKEVYNNLGVIYNHKGSIDKAIQFYEKSIKLSPNTPTVYYNYSFACESKGDVSKAIILCEKAIALDSLYANAYLQLGNMYNKNNFYGKAIPVYKKAIKINPLNAVVYYNLGIAYYKSSNIDAAVLAYNKAIEINPKYSDAYFNLGICYHISNHTKAIELYRNAAKLGDNDAKKWLKENGYTW